MYRQYFILISFFALFNSSQSEFKKRHFKKRTTKPVVFKLESIQPSLEYLKNSIKVDKVNSKSQQNHDFNIEPLDNIGEGIIKTNSTKTAQNVRHDYKVEPEDEIGKNIIKTKKSVKKHRKNILPGYEGFYNVINYGKFPKFLINP